MKERIRELATPIGMVFFSIGFLGIVEVAGDKLPIIPVGIILGIGIGLLLLGYEK